MARAEHQIPVLLDYRIDACRHAARELGVTLEFDLAPDRLLGAPQELFVSTWTPGSYLIREYGRHVSAVMAWDAQTGAALACRKTSKNRFEVASARDTRRVRIAYRVYAHELTVRTADVTPEHAFWNNACVLLWPVGELQCTARLRIAHPADWQLACSLSNAPAEPEPGGSGSAVTTVTAIGLEQALDAPILLGTLQRYDWDIEGVLHAIVFDGLAGIRPPDTLQQDLTRIVRAARAVFGGPLPYQSYLFLCLCSGDGHGGLEHADSSTLLVARTAFASTSEYREFLGLAAHELFHAWNVKRMRPAEFWCYDYEHENHTELLWLIEGWTAYYDDLLCRRAGLLRRDDYLALLAKNIGILRATPGRFALSLAASSFDAWIRLYRPDENTRNSSQNYYLNGSLAALCLDLFLRDRTVGRHGLDDVLRILYARSYGRGRGYTRTDVDAILRELGGDEVVEKLTELVDGPLDPDFGAALATVGIRLVEKDEDRPHLGVTFAAASTQITVVEAGSPAHSAGLAPGDEVLAVGNLRVTPGSWPETWKAIARVGTPIEVLVARRGVITQCTTRPQRSRGGLALELVADATPSQRLMRDAWWDPQGLDGAS